MFSFIGKVAVLVGVSKVADRIVRAYIFMNRSEEEVTRYVDFYISRKNAQIEEFLADAHYFGYNIVDNSDSDPTDDENYDGPSVKDLG